MIKKIIQHIFSIKYLRFRYYLFKAKTRGRYKLSKVSFSGYKLEVVDMLSFAWQYWEIIWKECYAFKAGSDMPIIIDCGGNIGLSALYFSNLYPKAIIKVIEADKKIAAICAKNIEANKKLNIELINKAVWIKDGSISFNSDGADGGKIDDSETTEKISCIDLRLFLQKFSTIDFLKMDIEGAETRVIPHIEDQLTKIKYLFIEYHSSYNQPQYLGEILNIIERQGFRYYIEDLNKKNKPLINYIAQHPFDLQLNIYAIHT